jgi:hypothetical protein
MFSMTKIKAVNGAGKAFYANHLAANDYYSEKEKVVGIWSGSLAFDFDLLGKGWIRKHSVCFSRISSH